MRILVAGGGIFGVTAALALRGRGHDVTLVDPGPLPHPLAESTDISKIVRADYGADETYTALGERALDGWRRWNRAWAAPPFEETGVTFLARAPLQPGGFEHDSFAVLTRRGHRLERLDAAAIARRFPAWRPGVHVNGYFNPSGGWARASQVVTELAARAAAAGVVMRGDALVAQLDDERGGAWIVPRGDGDPARAGAGPAADPAADLGRADFAAADLTIVCAGAWAARLVPELVGELRPVGQPVFHLRPADPARFAAARFPVFGADIARTGWYGFPVASSGDGADGPVVKLANHGVGAPLAVDAAGDARVVTAAQEAALRAFVADALPELAAAPIVLRRLCVYGDTRDEHFWIARHPARPRVAVASGGSGHAFKFAPVLGELIADLLVPDRGAAPDAALAARFGWRAGADLRGAEAARHRA